MYRLAARTYRLYRMNCRELIQFGIWIDWQRMLLFLMMGDNCADDGDGCSKKNRIGSRVGSRTVRNAKESMLHVLAFSLCLLPLQRDGIDRMVFSIVDYYTV